MFVNGCFVKFIYWFLLVESEQNFQTLKIFSFITFGGYQILKCYNFYNFWLRYVQKRKKCCSLVKPAVINIFYNRKYQNFITWWVFASHRTFVDIFGNCKLIWIYHRQVQTKITALEGGIGQNSLRNWLGVGLKKKDLRTHIHLTVREILLDTDIRMFHSAKRKYENGFSQCSLMPYK